MLTAVRERYDAMERASIAHSDECRDPHTFDGCAECSLWERKLEAFSNMEVNLSAARDELLEALREADDNDPLLICEALRSAHMSVAEVGQQIQPVA
jgi:hypothetical protein